MHTLWELEFLLSIVLKKESRNAGHAAPLLSRASLRGGIPRRSEHEAQLHAPPPLRQGGTQTTPHSHPLFPVVPHARALHLQIPPNEDEISDLLTAKDVASKISGLKTLISLQLNGEAMPKQLMTVIRFCVPENDHMIKKLLLVYWEVVEKTGPDGKLLPEMILVCNNLRNDLSHPNEYIRGCTLRFLCKLKEAEILEPLIPTIKNNLEHRHSFVRRNGVLAVFAIFKSFDYLLPDGPELVEKVLQTVRHGDSSVRLKGAAATASSRELPPHRNLTLRASATPSSCSSRRRKSAPLLFFPKISTR